MRRLLVGAALLALLLPAAALADHSVTELVAVPSNGVAPATVLPSGGFTADGNHAVLATNERLDPADTDSQHDVYLRSFLTDTTRLISVGPSGGNGPRSQGGGDGAGWIARDLQHERIAGRGGHRFEQGPVRAPGRYDHTPVGRARRRQRTLRCHAPGRDPGRGSRLLWTSEQLTAADAFNGPDVYERSAGVTHW